MMPLKAIAAALHGEVSGKSVIAPGPGHSARDRSLSVTPSATAPDGFLVFSHSGDDWQQCRDYVRAKLGIPKDSWKRAPEVRSAAPASSPDDDDGRVRGALAIWESSTDFRRTAGGLYLRRDRQPKRPKIFHHACDGMRQAGRWLAFSATSRPMSHAQ